jgi:hypothetical protein
MVSSGCEPVQVSHHLTLFGFTASLSPKSINSWPWCDDLEAKLQKSQKRSDRLMEAAVAEMLAA